MSYQPGLLTQTTYYRLRQIDNIGHDTAYTNVVTITVPPWSCGNILLDARDGKTYPTVQIGGQCWMGKNLNTGTKISSTAEQINNSIIEKYCYDNADANCNTYGGLYQWAEMVHYLNGATNNTTWVPAPTGNVIGICPTGWHLPADAEWTTLTSFLGGEAIAGGKMKETSTTHWGPPNTGANNSSGFTALPGGLTGTGGAFNYINYWGYFWSASVFNSNNSWTRSLYADGINVDRSYYYKSSGFSVHCIKN